MTPSGEQDLSREGLSFFLAMARSGDEKAVEVLMEEFDRLHRVIETVTEELEEYRSIAERIGAEKAVSMLVDTQQQLATMTAERDSHRTLTHLQEGQLANLRGTVNDLRQKLAASQARRAQVEEALREIADMLTEINPDNYDQDDVEAQNSSVIGAVNYARQFLTPTERPTT